MAEEKLNWAKEVADLKKELKNIVSDIPINPELSTIKELISETPSQIYVVRNKAIEVHKKARELKLDLKMKQKELENRKSEFRLRFMKGYKEKYADFVAKMDDLKKDLTKYKKELNHSFITEYIKANKPERPTQSTIDDYANLKTVKMQAELAELERTVLEYEAYYQTLEALADKLVDLKFSTNKHADIYLEELKHGLRHK